MLAVGTGIAPMAQIIQTVLNNEEDETMVTLLYGCKTYQDILLKSQINNWSRYWNFTCSYYLSQVSSQLLYLIILYPCEISYIVKFLYLIILYSCEISYIVKFLYLIIFYPFEFLI